MNSWSPTIPVIAVIGYKKTGKTTVIEGLVRKLTETGYAVATAKHIDHKGFTMDREGRDTWRHRVSGANPVIGVSDVETAVIYKDGLGGLTLRRLIRFTLEKDLLILEGFSKLVLEDETVGKIICVRTLEEYKEFRKRIRGETLAFCSLEPLGKPILSIRDDTSALIERVSNYLEKMKAILEIRSSLPNLDCGRCRYRRCWEMAKAIYDGKAKFDDCTVLKVGPRLKSRIMLNGAEVPIQPFVSEIVRRTVLGMISTLKGVKITGDERVHIEITSPRTA